MPQHIAIILIAVILTIPVYAWIKFARTPKRLRR
jgi:hypothetical protein